MAERVGVWRLVNVRKGGSRCCMCEAELPSGVKCWRADPVGHRMCTDCGEPLLLAEIESTTEGGETT